MSYSSLADLVKSFESGGNYTAQNPSGASGAYQFVPSTWQRFASQLGIDTTQYPTAASAPPQVQDAVFQQAYSQVGLRPWTCAGCDPPLTSYLASNPGAATLPVTDTAAPSGSSPGGSSTGTNQPSYLIPPVPMLGFPGVTNPLVDWWTGLAEFGTRALMFIFGAALILIGIAAVFWKSKTVQTTAFTAAKAVA